MGLGLCGNGWLRAEEGHEHETGGAAHAAPAGEHGEGDHAAGGHGEGEHGERGPMTADQADVDLAIWTLVTFVVFLFVLKKLAWVPITEGLQKRESAMFDNLAAAESARIKGEKLLAEHTARLNKVEEEIRELLAQAKRDAEHTKNEILATAQKEAEATRERAVHDIQQARDQALDELFGQVGRVVYQATEQVLGRSVTSVDNDRLIDEALAGFSQRKH